VKKLYLLFGIIAAALISSIALAAIPTTISIQGRLTDTSDIPVPSGSYRIQFRLYNDITAGNLLWLEEQNVFVDSNGVFHTQLGLVNTTLGNLPFDVPYWLVLNVSGQDLSPRINVTSSAFSFSALYARAYVNKSGDTMTGPLTIANSGDLTLKASAEDPGDLIFQNSVGTQKGRVWSNPSSGAALYLASSGTSPMLAIDSAGNVGIGTTSPGTKLDVVGTRVRLQTTSGTDGAYLSLTHGGEASGRNWMIGSAGSSNYPGVGKLDIYDGTAGASRMVIDSTGNVGIGTTNPGEKLEVNGKIKATNAIYSTGGQIYTQYPGGYGQVALNQWGLSSAGAIYIEPAAGNTLYLTDSWSKTGTLDFEFGKYTFQGGSVGIGTTSPTQKLDVVGGYARSDTGFCIGSSCITSWPSTGVTGSGTTNYISKWTGSSSIGNSQIYDNGTNVGIGTTSPSQKLDVSGNARVTGYISIGGLSNTRLSVTSSSGLSVADLNGNWMANISGAGGDIDLRRGGVYTNNGKRRPAFFVSVDADDCGGSHLYLGCPSGFIKAGRWHTGPGVCNSLTEGEGLENGQVDSGWMTLCVASEAV